MNFLARIAKFLFWLMVVSWSVALLRRLLTWMVGGAMPEETHEGAAGFSAGRGVGSAPGDVHHGIAARRLVRDPVCGLHVAEVLAVPLRDSGELVHFCSVACRDQYVDGRQRMAANG